MLVVCGVPTGFKNMKLKTIMLAVALAASSTGVHAGNIDGLPTPDVPLLSNGTNPLQYSGHFGNNPRGIFSDVFTFTRLDKSGNMASAEFSIDLDSAAIIYFGGATLNGVAFTQTGIDRWSLASILAPAGNLTLSVWGDATDGGSYGGDLNVLMAAAPVPEPETYAMLLGGLALLGMAARRRKQA